jgi:EAL domain-containing protein (putative c-di-GMP-specific phosphodiesterase class I)
MKSEASRVLAKLKQNRRGITFDDFGRGYRLGARIFDLRQAGFNIVTIKEALENGSQRARYVLR